MVDILRRAALSLLLLSGIIYCSAQSKPDDVKQFTLKNGMKFLVLEDHSIPNANMYLFWKVGSRNEHPGITGLSHFFEHMMFNGAKKFGPRQFDRHMEFNGGANNAYTTENVTVYTNWFPSSALETIFDLEADRIATLSIDSAMVESERGVVLSERSTGLENSPWRLLGEAVNATAFTEHPYHWSVIGYETDIKGWKKKDLEDYFKTYYAPNNCVAVIVGDVTLEAVEKLARQYIEPIPAQTPPPPIHLTEPPQTGERRITVQKDVTSPYLQIAYHVPATRDSDYYALDVLSSALTDGKSSRLYSALVDEKQLAASISSGYDESFDPTLFQLNAVTAGGIKAEDLEAAIYTELDKVKKDGITTQELQKIKNQKLMQFYGQIERIDGKANSIGTYEVFFGDYKKMYNAPTEYSRVSIEDVKRVASKYFLKSNRTVGVIKANVEE